MEHKEVEDLVNAVHDKRALELLKDFDRFMKKHEDDLVILPYYVIADYCLQKENRNPIRSDVLSIKSVMKVKK